MLTQWRHDQFDDVQAVVEILTELAGFDQAGEILVRGADQADVDRYLLRAADRANTPFLDRAQQLDLHRLWQVGDLVEKQGAALGALKQPFLVLCGAGEAALDVTEQLAFDQVGRDRAAVDGDERRGGARAVGMDQVRGEFLAGAGFPADEHRRLAAPELQYGLAHPVDGLGVAEQHRAFRIGAGLSACAARWRGRLQLQRGGDELAQVAEIDRFGDKVEGAGLQRADRGLHAAVRGDHRARHRRVAAADMSHQVDAVAIRQAHVGQAEVEVFAFQELSRGAQVGRRAGADAHSAEGDLQQFADIRFVVDDQRGRSTHRRPLKVSRKQLPPVGGGI